MSSGVIFLVALGLLAFFGPTPSVAMKLSTMRVQTQLSPGGTWSSPPVAGSIGDIDATIQFKREARMFWSSAEYSILITSASANGTSIPTAQVLAAWRERLAAGDTRWASVDGEPLTVAEQNTAIDTLAARETARALAAVPPAAAGGKPFGDPLSVVTPPFMRWGAHAGWVIPVSLILLSLVLAVGRAGRRATIRARFVRLKSGICPECGYSRSGIADDKVCPECGEDPADVRAIAMREMQRLMKAKAPASP